MAKKKKESVVIAEESAPIEPSAYQALDRTGILPCESMPEETKLVNEPVAITEIKPLSEEMLASLYDKHGIPKDFNASHPRWNVPSMKNRYALLLADIAVHEKL